uniref:Protein YIP n=1 Tax=Kalanchoe fedtschenkoi TaxID=63787 RepID=A0A7N0T6K7_KALFE
MDDNYATLPTSHLLGSVPAAVSEEKNAGTYEVPGSSMQTFPPNSGGDRSRSGQGYHTYDSPHEGDVVLNRLLSSLYPHTSDFFSKIDANPDLYGLIWISTTLVFVLASLGNCATYLMDKRTDSSTSWSFDVSYVNWAAGSIYGYVILVPLAFYFLLQYLGSNTSLIRFWCLWGYSLFIFILSSFLLVIPVEFLRWIIIIATGVASSSFVSLNLKSYIEGTDVALVLVASFVLQMALAVFIKMSFFP